MTKLLRLVDNGRKELRTTTSMSARIPPPSNGESISLGSSSAVLHDVPCLRHSQSVPVNYAQYRSLTLRALPAHGALSVRKDLSNPFVVSEQPRLAKYEFSTFGRSSEPGAPKRRLEVTEAVKPIAWRYGDYAVAPNHLLTSTSADAMDEVIRQLLKHEQISYVVETQDSLKYVCRKSVGSAVYKFTILVSSLLKSCQDLLKSKYLVEVVRSRTSGVCEPMVWGNLVCSLLADLSNGLGVSGTNESTNRNTLCTTLDVSSSEPSDHENWILSREDTDFDPVDSFLRVFETQPPNIETEHVAEMMLEGSKSILDAGGVLNIHGNGLDTVQGLLYQGSTHFKRCTCMILENIAKSGGLATANKEGVNNVFRELLRMLFLYKAEYCSELNLATLRALNALDQVAQPSEVDSILLEKAVRRFQAFDDVRLQDQATQLSLKYHVEALAPIKV